MLPHPQNLGGPVATVEVVLSDSEAGCLDPASMLCYKDIQATGREHREPASGARHVRKETPVPAAWTEARGEMLNDRAA